MTTNAERLAEAKEFYNYRGYDPDDMGNNSRVDWLISRAELADRAKEIVEHAAKYSMSQAAALCARKWLAAESESK